MGTALFPRSRLGSRQSTAPPDLKRPEDEVTAPLHSLQPLSSVSWACSREGKDPPSSCKATPSLQSGQGVSPSWVSLVVTLEVLSNGALNKGGSPWPRFLPLVFLFLSAPAKDGLTWK